MRKFKKAYNYILIFTFSLISFNAYSSYALRAPLHGSLADEAISFLNEKETIKSYIEELLKEIDGRIYETGEYSYEVVSPDRRLSLKEFLEKEIDKKFSGYNIDFPEKPEFEKVGTRKMKVNLYNSENELLDTFSISLFVNHIPFGKFIGSFNRLYYTLKGTQITVTPETATAVSHDSTTAEANAIEFYEHLKALDKNNRLPETIVVQGWAVGNGTFDRDFIRKFLELDEVKGKDYSKRLKYVLVDFSELALEKARKELQKYESIVEIETVVKDLSKEINIYHSKTHYIRFNELYDDLPGALIVSKEEGEYYQWFVKPNFNIPKDILLKNGDTLSRDEFIMRYFYQENFKDASLLPDNILRGIGLNTWVRREIDVEGHKYGDVIKGYLEETDITERTDKVLLNIGALDNLVNASFLLDKDGYIQFYDYGNMGYEPAYPTWYRLNYDWGQATCDVDFAFLNYALQKLGFKNIVVEKQSRYLSKVLRQEVIPRRYVVATSRDNYEGAGLVSLKLIPGLEEVKSKKSLKKNIGRHLKDAELEDLFKKSIAQELLLLWQGAINRGKPWIRESQIRSISLVGYLTDKGKDRLIENLSNPEIRSKFPYNTRNIYYHFKLELNDVDLSLIKKRFKEFKRKPVDL